MITVIFDNSKIELADIIKNAFSKNDINVVFFAAETLNIEPCIGCSSCSGKTFGHCVVKDDMNNLLSKMVRSNIIVLISPIVYGSVSYHIKKVMDKMAVIGDPRYYMRNGEMVKKMRIPKLEYYMIGFKEKLTEEEKLTFINLHKENIRIMDVTGKVYAINNILDENSFRKIIKEICYG